MAALSLGVSPVSSMCPAVVPSAYLEPLPENNGASASPLDSVDTLLGLSTSLWPILHRLSQLLPFKKSLERAMSMNMHSKASVLRTELESTSQAIENALTRWKANIQPAALYNNAECPENMRMQSIYYNAEAYRHSALVYLHRTIQSRARNHPSVQGHTHASLEACCSVVRSSRKCQHGPMSALLWPLFVAAVEAATSEDQKLAREAFDGIEQKQGFHNIVRAREVVEEVWQRTGDGIECEWRDICKERGFSIVFG